MLSNNFSNYETIIIGDAQEEIRIGEELHTYAIGITGGYNSEKRLKEAGLCCIVHSLSELPDLVEKIAPEVLGVQSKIQSPSPF